MKLESIITKSVEKRLEKLLVVLPLSKNLKASLELSDLILRKISIEIFFSIDHLDGQLLLYLAMCIYDVKCPSLWDRLAGLMDRWRGRGIRPIFCCDRFEKISAEEARILEKEVWDAISAEGLNTIVSEAMANGVFRGVKVEVSGLRVNYSKSKLYGIGVNEMELNYMVRLMGCGFGDFPFTYLGIRVGEDMRRINAWNVVVD
ncbi:hypothetical protein Tco_1255319, partial [Tanacetum coccineum]